MSSIDNELSIRERRLRCMRNQTVGTIETKVAPSSETTVGSVETSTGVKSEGAYVCPQMQKSRRVELADFARAMRRTKKAELAKSTTSIPIVSVPIPVPSQCCAKVEVAVVANVAKTPPSAVASFYESISSDPNYIYAAVILLTLLLVLLYTILCAD
jgi:hypothetical protein